MNQSTSEKNYTLRYTVFGIVFGLCFPLFASILGVIEHNLTYTVSNIIKVLTLDAPISFIIATAPIFLGIFASFAGKRQDKLTAEIQERIQVEEELKLYRDKLEDLVASRTAELEEAQKQLLDTAHRAGMAEIATNVLHNIGNVLNSAITSTVVASETLRGSKLATLKKLVDLINAQKDNFSDFVANDPKGKKLPEFLSKLCDAFSSEHEKIEKKHQDITTSHDHIRGIIGLQQSYAGVRGVAEKVHLPDLVNDAAKLFGASFDRHNIQFTLTYGEELPKIITEKNKLLQVFVNLLKNARDATKEGPHQEGKIEVVFSQLDNKSVQVNITDNGIGIEEENLTKIFNYGFTTKPTGHGFGLHGSANLATELGGKLTVSSPGLGLGATFSIVLSGK
ncbi:MAG: HAMP domain-containing histidine kinase [Bacteroidetes bacterium]|nr:HAMP domain-containing histidine kinase [Bacteroidota bacterium]MBT7617214.1 HAMP domain-containing histidine kinase [Calditrichota bacterium]MBT7790251.1 HAMP domain-containing histidine kinase [Calditrichota bacterium]